MTDNPTTRSRATTHHACPACGSSDVAFEASVNVNTGEVIGSAEIMCLNIDCSDFTGDAAHNLVVDYCWSHTAKRLNR